MTLRANAVVDFALLGLLALLWGSSYPLIKIAVADIPPLTLIAVRVGIAALFLLPILLVRNLILPRDVATWGRLLIQAFFNSIGAWTVLAWGQQFIDSGVASVLNSTSPIFVFIAMTTIARHERPVWRKLLGAALGVTGVALIVGVDLSIGSGSQLIGKLACLSGAVFYACAAIHGQRFVSLGPVVTSVGTMICASLILLPAAVLFDEPFTLRPSLEAMGATLLLSTACTGLAFLIYFRLVNTLGSMGVASQAYLRACVGVLLGMVLLGETFTATIAIGLVVAIMGVVLINWPSR